MAHAVRACAGSDSLRSCLHDLLAATDQGLLGSPRPIHRTGLHQCWQNASDRADRWRLVITQALHWLAFVVVINMLLLPTVQRNFSANATGLAIFTLLSLGTFTAGVHLLSWQVCLLGLIMALGIRVLAWVENSALFLLLISAAVLGFVAVVWWHWRERREPSRPRLS